MKTEREFSPIYAAYVALAETITDGVAKGYEPFCANCITGTTELKPEEFDGRVVLMCKACREESASSPRYAFVELSPSGPLGKKHKPKYFPWAGDAQRR